MGSQPVVKIVSPTDVHPMLSYLNTFAWLYRLSLDYDLYEQDDFCCPNTVFVGSIIVITSTYIIRSPCQSVHPQVCIDKSVVVSCNVGM